MFSPSSSSSDGSEWIKTKDSKGRTFYANRLTRKTQWEIPAVLLQKRKEEEWGENTTQQIAMQLPPFWEERIDPSSKRSFYVNHVDRITTWEHPGLKSSYNNKKKEESATVTANIAPHTGYENGTCDQEIGGTSNYFSQHKPQKEFELYCVADDERTYCQACNLIFNVGRRKHHCRSCGDIFCVTCSSQKCLLPTVETSNTDSNYNQLHQRVCNLCYNDIQKQKRGITHKPLMRRYLPTLQLLHRTQPNRVLAALTSFTNDLNTKITSHEETDNLIPAEIIVPTLGILILRPVVDDITSIAINALATLLAFGSVVGDLSFAAACFYPIDMNPSNMNHTTSLTTLQSVLLVMENIDQIVSSCDTNIATKEQSARALFYVTEKNVIEVVLGHNDTNAVSRLESLHIPKALQIMLDHAIISSSAPSEVALQRWCAGSIRHIILEDNRRAVSSKDYESFIASSNFIASGSVMILCSLMGADDADTRAHATSTLTFVVDSLRAMATTESTSILSSVIQQICENACGDTLGQLLMSADNSVVSLGLSLIFSMVSPLLMEPFVRPLPKDTSLTPSIAAALKVSNETCCLTVFVQIIQSDNGRPIELRAKVMQCLAAICLACSATYSISKVEDSRPFFSPSAAAVSLSRKLQSHRVLEVCVSVLSQSSQGIVFISGEHHDKSPSSQLLETAAISLGAILDFSDSFSNCLLLDWMKKIIFDLFSIASEPGMQSPSKLRGMWIVRCLPFIDCASKLIHRIVVNSFYDGQSTGTLDCLLEAIDAGAISIAIDVISNSGSLIAREVKERKAVNELCGQLMLQICSCRILDDIFCLSIEDRTLIGRKRLNQAMASFSGNHEDKYKKWRGTLVSAISNMLNEAAQLFDCRESPGEITLSLLQELIQGCTSVLASIAGAPTVMNGNYYTSSATDFGGGVSQIAPRDQDRDLLNGSPVESCCEVITAHFLLHGNGVLPMMLVGGLGEGCIDQSIRLICAIVSNGSNLIRKVSLSGILLPLLDMLQNSEANEFRFNYSIFIIRCCCPFIPSDGTVISSMRKSVEIIAKELTSGTGKNVHKKHFECIRALDAMSKNPSLWNSLGASLPFIVDFMNSTHRHYIREGSIFLLPLCMAIRTLQNVIQKPSLALKAADSELSESLCHLIKENITTRNNECHKMNDNPITSLSVQIEEENGISTENDAQVLALDVLATIAFHCCSIKSNDSNVIRLLQCGFIDSACFILSQRGVEGSDCTSEAIVVKGLSLIFSFLNSDFKSSSSTGEVIQVLGKQHSFIKTLLATMLTEEKIADRNLTLRVYGPPLIIANIPFSGFQSLCQAAATLLILIASISSGLTGEGEYFWRLLSPLKGSVTQKNDITTASTIACSAILLWSSVHNIAQYSSPLQCFVRPLLPAVKKELLERICMNISTYDTSMIEMSINEPLNVVVQKEIHQLCFEMCKFDNCLVIPSSVLFKIIQEKAPNVLADILCDKHRIESFFYMFGEPHSVSSAKILCEMLLSISRPCLENLVNKYEMKGAAIDTLASVFHRLDAEELKSSTPVELLDTKEIILWCLLSLSFPHVDMNQIRLGNEQLVTSQIELNISEAQALASSIGGSLSLMIMDKFVNLASSTTSIEKRKKESVEELELLKQDPESLLFCALCSMNESLQIICELGVFEAIIVLVHEQDLNAVRVMQAAAKHHPLMVIESDGHQCIIDVMCHQISGQVTSRPLLLSCMDCLTNLCKSSRRGRMAIINSEITTQAAALTCELMLQVSCTSKIFALSCSLLTQLSRSGLHRKTIVKNESVLELCSKIVGTEENYETACEATKLLAALAPTLADNSTINFNAESLAETFILVYKRNSPLLSDESGDAEQLHWYYELLSVASGGLACVINHLSTASRTAFLDSASRHFQALVVLSDDVARSTEPPAWSDAAGMLAYTLTDLFVKMSIEESWRLLWTESRIVSNFFLVIILYDLALEECNGQPLPDACNTPYWSSARTNCLQCISSLLCTDSSTQLFFAGLERAMSLSSWVDSETANRDVCFRLSRRDTWENCITFQHFLQAAERISSSDDSFAATVASVIISKLI